MAPELAADFERAWTLLAAAVADRASPLRTPVVATAAGGEADGRVMVLRAVDRPAATLTFFTDRRAAKVAAVAAAPRVAIVAWDSGAHLQLRLRGTATLVAAGPAVDAAWAGVPSLSRRQYRTLAAPGTVADSSDAAAEIGPDARANFALLIVTVSLLESLDLAGAIHRRAHYERVGADWVAGWRVP